MGLRRYDELVNKEKGKDYCYVNPSDAYFGVDYYKSIGYEIERPTADGVRPLLGQGKSDGEAITQLGQVLMSRPKEIGKEEFEMGQQVADSLDKKMIRTGGVDGLRGMVRGQSVENETTPSEYERRY